ncbi:MAG TPA: hypothetical protein ENI39_03960 [Anaerolineae bacterium]|nr:hypothetical protein [Anaerolineae bacterium]
MAVPLSAHRRVTNGRGFDLPILETWFVLARRPFPLVIPHLCQYCLCTSGICLPQSPQRTQSVWRVIHHPANAILQNLDVENDVGFSRSVISALSAFSAVNTYHQRRAGDGRILYHNQVEALSMVTLAARLGRAFAYAPKPNPNGS